MEAGGGTGQKLSGWCLCCRASHAPWLRGVMASEPRGAGGLFVLLKPGLHHKTNGRSGIEAAEESELLAVTEDDPIRFAEANMPGYELSCGPHNIPPQESRAC